MQVAAVKPGDESGFSLIELVLAMGVIGVVLIPMVTAYTLSLKSLRYSKNRQVATMLGKDCLTRLRSTVGFSSLPTTAQSIRCDGDDTGNDPYSFESPNSNFEYVTEVEEVSNAGGLVMKIIRIRVRFPSPFQGEPSCITDRSCNNWDFTTLVAQR